MKTIVLVFMLLAISVLAYKICATKKGCGCGGNCSCNGDKTPVLDENGNQIDPNDFEAVLGTDNINTRVMNAITYGNSEAIARS